MITPVAPNSRSSSKHCLFERNSLTSIHFLLMRVRTWGPLEKFERDSENLSASNVPSSEELPAESRKKSMTRTFASVSLSSLLEPIVQRATPLNRCVLCRRWLGLRQAIGNVSWLETG
jgi:hypothetical protein